MIEDRTHGFTIRSDLGIDARVVRAACSCGWEGDAHIVAEGGLDEALDQHRMHIADVLLEMGEPTV